MVIKNAGLVTICRVSDSKGGKYYFLKRGAVVHATIITKASKQRLDYKF